MNDARVTLVDEARNMVAIHTTKTDGGCTFADLSGPTYTASAHCSPCLGALDDQSLSRLGDTR